MKNILQGIKQKYFSAVIVTLVYTLFLVSIIYNSHAYKIADVVDVDSLLEEKLKQEDKYLVKVILEDNERISFKGVPKDFSSRMAILKEKKKDFLKKEDSVLSTLNEEDFTPTYKSKFSNSFTGYITLSGLEKLKKNPKVKKIIANREIKLSLDESSGIINAPSVYKIQQNGINISGKGQTVCVIDSGIDYTLQALGGCTQQEFLSGNCDKVLYGYDFYYDKGDPMDLYGHGTHVAGIVASTDSTYQGIAPEASLVTMKICSDTSDSCNDVQIEDAVDECLNYAEQFNISVITISVNDPTVIYSEDNCNGKTYQEEVTNKINLARDTGLIVTISSGNKGSTTGISWPACTRGATSVGSTSKQNKMSSFTNRGNNLDLLAPGEDIDSLKSSEFNMGLPKCYELPNGLVRCSGTSQATPHVAGAAALQ